MPAELKIVENKREGVAYDPLLTPEQVAKWLNTSVDWVWDHSSRKAPLATRHSFRGGAGAFRNSPLPGQQDRGIYCRAAAVFRNPAQEFWP
jgi:hypothetical protein